MARAPPAPDRPAGPDRAMTPIERGIGGVEGRNGYHVEEHVGGSAFDILQTDWEDLAARAPDAKPFQLWHFARGAWRMNHDPIVPRIFVIRDDAGRAVAILALGTARTG